MAFHNVPFPADLAVGATGGPVEETDIIVNGGGLEQRNQEHDYSRWRWNVGTGINTTTEYEELLTFFRARRGKTHSFPFLNPFDSVATDTVTGTGDGSTTTFDLNKTYEDAGGTYLHRIKHPIAVTDVKVAGVSVPFTANLTAGTITIPGSPQPANGAEITWTGTFYHAVRFDTNHMAATFEEATLNGWPDVPIIEVLDE